MGGPIWNREIHSLIFVEKLKSNLQSGNYDFKTSKRLFGMLQLVSEELPNAPLFYGLDRISRVLHCTTPKMKDFRSAILNAGYQVSYSHAYKTSVKTNAPSLLIWDIMREWCKANPPKNIDKVSFNDAGKIILSKEPKHIISFLFNSQAEPMSKEMQLLRYQVNPAEDWGPKPKPANSVDKRAKNQNKRKRSKSCSELKVYSCKRFEKGECELGEACRYKHI